MKRAKGHGFLLSLLLNMVFRGFWLVLVAVLVILHFAAGWPLWLIAIPLVAWFIHALLITLVLGFAQAGRRHRARNRKTSTRIPQKRIRWSKSPWVRAEVRMQVMRMLALPRAMRAQEIIVH